MVGTVGRMNRRAPTHTHRWSVGVVATGVCSVHACVYWFNGRWGLFFSFIKVVTILDVFLREARRTLTIDSQYFLICVAGRPGPALVTSAPARAVYTAVISDKYIFLRGTCKSSPVILGHAAAGGNTGRVSPIHCQHQRTRASLADYPVSTPRVRKVDE